MAKKDVKLVDIVRRCFEEADDAKSNRMELNKRNFDAFHMRQDWSHKKEGQSREFLGKVNLAVQQIASFVQQGLVDVGTWFGVGVRGGSGSDEKSVVEVNDVKKVMMMQHEDMLFHNFVEDMVKEGLLGSLIIVKVRGQMVNKPKYVAKNVQEGMVVRKRLEIENDKVWELKYDLIRPQDFYLDPTGRDMYCIQRLEMDYYELLELAKDKDSPYDLAVVKGLSKDFGTDFDRNREMQRETDQNMVGKNDSHRRTIIIDEFWGNIVDPDSGELLHENVMYSVANEKIELHKPVKNPFWHQKKPYVVAPIMRVPHSVWHKAVMDAASSHNMTMNEIYNLMVDGGMMAVHGIKQIRKDWLEDDSQVNGGIGAGTTLDISSTVPPGAKVLERIDTSSVPADGFNMFSIISGEFNQSSYTNELRLGGIPKGEVKATEVVESSQTITGIFGGIAKNLEVGSLEPIMEMGWMVTAQHFKQMDKDKLQAVLGDKYEIIAGLSNEEIFAETVNGMKFQVFGVSRTLNKMKDFRKSQGLLQTVGSSDVLMEAFAQKYDFTKLLDVIIQSLDIDTDKIELDEAKEQMEAQQGAPQVQSQIPQAGAAVNEVRGEEGGIPQSEFPPSRAGTGR